MSPHMCPQVSLSQESITYYSVSNWSVSTTCKAIKRGSILLIVHHWNSKVQAKGANCRDPQRFPFLEPKIYSGILVKKEWCPIQLWVTFLRLSPPKTLFMSQILKKKSFLYSSANFWTSLLWLQSSNPIPHIERGADTNHNINTMPQSIHFKPSCFQVSYKAKPVYIWMDVNRYKFWGVRWRENMVPITKVWRRTIWSLTIQII